jgi:hypothetical protein
LCVQGAVYTLYTRLYTTTICDFQTFRGDLVKNGLCRNGSATYNLLIQYVNKQKNKNKKIQYVNILKYLYAVVVTLLL